MTFAGSPVFSPLHRNFYALAFKPICIIRTSTSPPRRAIPPPALPPTPPSPIPTPRRLIPAVIEIIHHHIHRPAHRLAQRTIHPRLHPDPQLIAHPQMRYARHIAPME